MRLSVRHIYYARRLLTLLKGLFLCFAIFAILALQVTFGGDRITVYWSPEVCQSWNRSSTPGEPPLCPLLPCQSDSVDSSPFPNTFFNDKYLGPGRWAPTGCRARHKMAVIVPYRNRSAHLSVFLERVTHQMKHQLVAFQLILVEQNGTDLFNKARLMNAGFAYLKESGRQGNVSCVMFHDVDMVPEEGQCPYTCPQPGRPRHVGAYVDTLEYRQPYASLVGGALAMAVDDFETVNGFSNQFWGYGGEDDDMGLRIIERFGRIERPYDRHTCSYTMLSHTKRTHANHGYVHGLLNSSVRRMKQGDGLSAPQSKLLQVLDREHFVHLLVDVGTPPAVFVVNTRNSTNNPSS